MPRDKELTGLVEKLKVAVWANLKAVLLYGSAVTGEFQPKFSDLNVLCAFERLDAVELEKLRPAVLALFLFLLLGASHARGSTRIDLSGR